MTRIDQARALLAKKLGRALPADGKAKVTLTIDGLVAITMAGIQFGADMPLDDRRAENIESVLDKALGMLRRK